MNPDLEPEYHEAMVDKAFASFAAFCVVKLASPDYRIKMEIHLGSRTQL